MSDLPPVPDPEVEARLLEETDNREIPEDGPQPSQEPDLFPLEGEDG